MHSIGPKRRVPQCLFELGEPIEQPLEQRQQDGGSDLGHPQAEQTQSGDGRAT